MNDLKIIPEDGNFVCMLDISKGTDVSTVIDLCKNIKQEFENRGVDSDRFIFCPVGTGSPINSLDIIPDNRNVAVWVEYPRAHYYKCSICKYTIPYKKATEYKFCPSCGRVIVGWANKNDM